MKKLIFLFVFIFIFILFITCLSTYIIFSNNSFTTGDLEYYSTNSKYSWPLVEHHSISSNFGFRISPISGLPSYHSGIDIPAPERNQYLFNL